MSAWKTEEWGLVNLKRSIYAFEQNRVALLHLGGVALLVVPLLMVTHDRNMSPWAGRVLTLGCTLASFRVGWAVGSRGARGISHKLLTMPHCFLMLYVSLLVWSPVEAVRLQFDFYFRSRSVAARLGVPFETYARWRRDSYRFMRWCFPVFVAVIVISVALGMLVGEVLFRFATQLPAEAREAITARTVASLFFPGWAGIVIGLPTCWTRQFRPKLEAETGLSVVEVMREFGYRPAPIIGWLKIGSGGGSATAGPRDGL